MKTKDLAFALLAAAPLSLLFADDVPKPFTFARYQAMLDRSPFAVATAVAAPSATPNFAKDLYVAGAAHSKDGDFVTVASSADKNFKRYLTTNAPEDGYSITNIEWSDKVGATKVTIAKDGQTATLTFNEALLKQSVATGQPPMQMQQQQPNVQPQPQPIVPPPVNAQQQQTLQQQRPAPIPQLPTPPPRVRGVIPKNPNAAVTPMQGPVVAPTPEVEL
jgi:biotin carboxyl carrier protein